MLKPQISLTWVKSRKANTEVTPEQTFQDYVTIAEEAADRIAKKLLVGAVVTVTTFVALTLAGSIAITAFDHHLNES